MGKKTLWAVCTLNVLASGFALAWVTRPYWQARPKPAFEVEAPKPPAKDTDICWVEFAAANTLAAAQQALAGMPTEAERHARLKEFLKVGDTQVIGHRSAAAAARLAAALAFWGSGIETGSGDEAWLRRLAVDQNRSPLERETALRAVVLAAQRRHKSAAPEDSGEWREALAVYLDKSDFGRGSSVEGLALQAKAFALAEKIAPVSRADLMEDLGLVLSGEHRATESTVVSALDVARQVQARELVDTVRKIARQSESDACRQAALNFLAMHGTAEDLSWLDEYMPTNASLQIAGANVRAVLAARLAAPLNEAVAAADMTAVAAPRQ